MYGVASMEGGGFVLPQRWFSLNISLFILLRQLPHCAKAKVVLTNDRWIPLMFELTGIGREASCHILWHVENRATSRNISQLHWRIPFAESSQVKWSRIWHWAHGHPNLRFVWKLFWPIHPPLFCLKCTYLLYMLVILRTIQGEKDLTLGVPSEMVWVGPCTHSWDLLSEVFFSSLSRSWVFRLELPPWMREQPTV